MRSISDRNKNRNKLIVSCWSSNLKANFRLVLKPKWNILSCHTFEKMRSISDRNKNRNKIYLWRIPATLLKSAIRFIVIWPRAKISPAYLHLQVSLNPSVAKIIFLNHIDRTKDSLFLKFHASTRLRNEIYFVMLKSIFGIFF